MTLAGAGFISLGAPRIKAGVSVMAVRVDEAEIRTDPEPTRHPTM